MKTEQELKEIQITALKEIISDLIEGVVSQPAKAQVTHHVRGSLVAFIIQTAQSDVRRVIGSKGKHFRAIEVIASEALRRIGMESHIAIDEKTPTGPIPTAKDFGLGAFQSKKFKEIKDLLQRVVCLFASDESSVEVIVSDIGMTALIEIQIATSDHPSLYGRPAEFDYGTDGHLIGAIKNFFDGIAKNRGKTIRITVSKV